MNDKMSKTQHEMPAWYPHYAKDWLTSDNVMSMGYFEKGVFIQLLSIAWVNDGLPNNEAKAKQMLGLCLEEWEACAWIVRELFYDDGTKLRNKRQEVERKKYTDKVDKLRIAGSLGGKKKRASKCLANAKQKLSYTEPEPEPYSKSNKKFSHTEIDNIYKAYPRHTAPVAAKKAIEKALLKSGLNYDTMMERVKKFAQSKKGRGEFCPHPATWFNQGRYDDDPAEWDKEYKKDGYMSDDEITRANIEKVKYNPRG